MLMAHLARARSYSRPSGHRGKQDDALDSPEQTDNNRVHTQTNREFSDGGPQSERISRGGDTTGQVREELCAVTLQWRAD